MQKCRHVKRCWGSYTAGRSLCVGQAAHLSAGWLTRAEGCELARWGMWWHALLESTLVISSSPSSRGYLREHRWALIHWNKIAVPCSWHWVVLWVRGGGRKEGYDEQWHICSPLPRLSFEIIICKDQALYSTSFTNLGIYLFVYFDLGLTWLCVVIIKLIKIKIITIYEGLLSARLSSKCCIPFTWFNTYLTSLWGMHCYNPW